MPTDQASEATADQPTGWPLKHVAQAHKGFRGRIPGPDRGEGGEPWRDHLAAHREELHRLRDELP
jgi:hypothetical protein